LEGGIGAHVVLKTIRASQVAVVARNQDVDEPLGFGGVHETGDGSEALLFLRDGQGGEVSPVLKLGERLLGDRGFVACIVELRRPLSIEGFRDGAPRGEKCSHIETYFVIGAGVSVNQQDPVLSFRKFDEDTVR
jgi:hypothetical protein